MNFKITLDDLIKVNPNAHVILRKERLGEIESKIKDKFNSLTTFSKKVGLSRHFIYLIIRGSRNPNIHLALNIIHKLNLKIKDCIEKITLIAKPNGSFINIKSFPINATPNLASLVGHSFGDGHISNAFGYTNTSQRLINDVIERVHKLPVEKITMNYWFHKAHDIRFSKLVRDILVVAGAPKGNKITNRYRLPDWIKFGSLKIKKAFLRALFDDEGSIVIKHRQILFCLSKNIELEDNLDYFLRELKSLLKEFKIKRVSITVSHFHEGTNGKTIAKHLSISGFFNFVNFQKNIDFAHPRKKKLLDTMIKNTKIIKMNRNERNEMIINILKNSPMLNAHQIAKMTGMSHKGTLNKLNELESEELISRTKDPSEAYFQHKPSFKWFINEF